jgi:hypothetical protein
MRSEIALTVQETERTTPSAARRLELYFFGI